MKSESKTIPPRLARAATAPQAPPPSSTSLPRHVLVQSRRKRFVEERHTNPTNAESPLLFSPKFAGKISPQLFNGYCHCPTKAKEKPEDRENLIPSSNGTDVNSSTCFTPFKTAFGTPSKLQTPSSKSLSLSTNGSKQCPHSAGAGPNERDKTVHSITRPPFRSLAKRNLGTCLFSPSPTLLPASPVAFEKLLSPLVKGLPKRVFLLPPQFSSPARRVPVYQKGSQPIRKHSPFETPKSSRTGQTKRGPCQSDDVIDDNVKQHHDNNDHNDDDTVKQGRKNLESLLKRVLVLPPQLSTPARRVPVHHKESQPRGKPSSFRTPKSCRTGGRKKGPGENDVDLLDDDLKQHYDDDGDNDGLLPQVEQLQTQVDCPVV